MSRLRYDEIKGALIINCEHLTAEDIEAIWALSSNDVDEDIGRHGIVVSRSRKTVSEREALLVQHLEEQRRRSALRAAGCDYCKSLAGGGEEDGGETDENSLSRSPNKPTKTKKPKAPKKRSNRSLEQHWWKEPGGMGGTSRRICCLNSLMCCR